MISLTERRKILAAVYDALTAYHDAKSPSDQITENRREHPGVWVGVGRLPAHLSGVYQQIEAAIERLRTRAR